MWITDITETKWDSVIKGIWCWPLCLSYVFMYHKFRLFLIIVTVFIITIITISIYKVMMVIGFVLQGKGAGASMFVQSLRGDPFRVMFSQVFSIFSFANWRKRPTLLVSRSNQVNFLDHLSSIYSSLGVFDWFSRTLERYIISFMLNCCKYIDSERFMSSFCCYYTSSLNKNGITE